MPQRKQILWSQLKVGILSVVAIALAMTAIFLVTGEMGLFTRKMTIRTLTPDAGGIKSGAPVRLAGIDVGTVKAVGLSGLPQTAQAVEITMTVNQKYQDLMRSDSEVFLAAEGLLGERYINISRGTPKGTAIKPGDIIPFHSTAEFSQLVGGAGDLIDNLNVLTTRLNSIVGGIDSGQGTVGKLLKDDTLYRRLDTTINEAEKLVAGLSNGRGTLGQLLASDDVYNHINVTVAKLESIADMIEKGDGTFQKLMRDPSLYQKADQMISKGSLTIDNINQGHGTLGKLAQDDELYRRINGVVAGIDEIVANLRKGEGAAGLLLHDRALYDNLNSTSVEVRELLADFRKDPKKFLTIHFRIF